MVKSTQSNLLIVKNEMTRDCFDAAKEDVDILFALGLVIVEIGASRFNVLTAVSELRMGVISLIAII